MDRSQYDAEVQEILQRNNEILTKKNKEVLAIFQELRKALLKVRKAVRKGNDELAALNNTCGLGVTKLPHHEFRGFYYEHYEELLSDAPGGICSMIRSHAEGNNYI